MARPPGIPQALFEDVKAVVVATLDIEDQADDLEPETGLYGNLAELDSLTVVRLIVALQKRFGSRSRLTRSRATFSTLSGDSRPSWIQGALRAPLRSHDRRSRRRTMTTSTTGFTRSRAALTESGRAYWQGMLAAGGSTTVPRRALNPVPGVADHEMPISRDTVVAARRLACDLGVPLRTVLLAAHASVLAVLSGERDVVVGYVADPAVRPLPCRLSTEPASWLEMVQQIRRVESALRAYAGFPVDDLRRELGLAGPVFETVFDPNGTADGIGDIVLHVGFPSGTVDACCCCGTEPTCWTPVAPPGSPTPTSPRSDR
jgi:acyl carrier protein